MAKRNRKLKVNWNYVIYLVRKGISKIGWVSVGAYLVPILQDKLINPLTIGGLALAFAVAILATLDNEKPVISNENKEV